MCMVSTAISFKLYPCFLLLVALFPCEAYLFLFFNVVDERFLGFNFDLLDGSFGFPLLLKPSHIVLMNEFFIFDFIPDENIVKQ
jgi:hypothetical protein